MMKDKRPQCQNYVSNAFGFHHKPLNHNKINLISIPNAVYGERMDKVFDKFSLSLILRQLLCGVVFFLPQLQYGIKIGDSLALSIGFLSLIIGTFIYHIEKNTYSYLVQGILYKLIQKNLLVTDILALIFIVLCGYLCLEIWDSAFFALLLMIIVCASIGFSIILIDFYEKVWSIDKDTRFKGEIIIKPSRILAHLDTWSDNIHCIQCCCFAWILGSLFSKYAKIQYIVGKCGFVDCVTFIKSKEDMTWGILTSRGCLIAYLILVLELFFEFHRFYHLYKISEQNRS